MIKRRVTLVLAMVAAAGFCQSSLQPPTTGYVLDQSGALRTIVGIPGAAVLGDPLVPGFLFSTVRTAPQRNYVLGLAQGGNSAPVLVTGLGSAAPIATTISGAIAADLLATNDGGTMAATYSSKSEQLQFIGGLPGAPIPNEPISPGGGAPISALALQGNTIVYATSNGTSGALYYLAAVRRHAVSRYIAPAGRVTAIGFANGGGDLVYADALRNEVVILRNFRTSADPIVFATAKDGVSQPVALRVVQDHVFVASAGSRLVLNCDLRANSITPTTLQIAPTKSDEASDAWLVLNEPRDGAPLYLMNTITNEVVFVPVNK